MKDLYAEILERELVHEGGYVNHPADPGGATMKGVTQDVYDGYRRRNKLPTQSVRLISNTELQDIYRLQYWNKIRGDSIPAGVDYVVFDGAINSGPSQSTKWVQRALGFSPDKVDGMLGEATLEAIRKHPDHDRLIADILRRRMDFLMALKTWKTFGKGWKRRVDEVRSGGQAWASGSIPSAAEYVPGMEHKADVKDAKPIPSKAVADNITGGGTIAVVLSQAQDQLTPYASTPFVAKLLLGITVVGAVLAVGGGLYRSYATRRAAQLTAALDLEVAA